MKNRFKRGVGVIGIIFLSGALGGCSPGLGWLGSVFAPPEKIKAVYHPPKGKKVLVFVDDIKRPVSYSPIKGELTRLLNRRLTEANVAAETVPYEKMLDLVAATPDFNHLPVATVGRRLGAELVVYVHIDKFSLKEEEIGTLWQGRFEASVRVVDVRKGVLWPKDRPMDGFDVPPIKTPATIEVSPTYGRKLSQELAEKMAERIAFLFYDHEVPAESMWNRDN